MTSIGDYAFSSCDKLTAVYIGRPAPDITSLGYDAFSGCPLLSAIHVPDAAYQNAANWSDYASAIRPPLEATPGLSYALVDDSYIVSIGTATDSVVYIPASYNGKYVTGIADYGFMYCDFLAQVVFGADSKVARIGYQAFMGCGELASIALPDSLTEIVSLAFYNCVGLMDATLPDGLASIGGLAFSGCIALRSIAIPSSVTYIDNAAFAGCNELDGITVADGNPYKGDGNCLIRKSDNTLLFGNKHSALPDYITKLWNYAFYKCNDLTGIVIPVGVTHIGDGAFYGCVGLTCIVMPAGVTYIGENAFLGCVSLTCVVMSTGVTHIGEGAFSDCYALSTVYYGGADSAAWSGISIESDGNACLADATFYYYSAVQPAESGDYWHWVGDVPTVW
jgi:hypothetical protein